MAQQFANYDGNFTQLGRETTPGTPVAATLIWRGPFSGLSDDRTRNQVEEQTGTVVSAERSYDTALLGGLSMKETELTYEQVLHILEAGLMTATPSGAGPYTYAYSIPFNGSVPTIKTYTIESGNIVATADQMEMEYSFVNDFTLSASAGEAWKMSANWVGRQLTVAARTAGLSLQAVEEAILAKTKLYIEDSGGNYKPTTQVTGVLMGFNLSVTTGWKIVPVGDGNLTFAGIKWTKPEITFTITYELEQDGSASRVATERAAYDTNRVRLLRLETLGSSSRALDIYFAARYDNFDDYQNSDGNTTVQANGRIVYSPTDAAFLNIDVTNNLASL